ELVGTSLGTWTWQSHDPTGLVAIGNPPSGAAGGYGWFDLAALTLAPVLLAAYARTGRRWLRVSSWSLPLVATALPPEGPGRPHMSVTPPPASVTMTSSAARSYSATSGSQAMSTAPSATSMYDQKSP